MLHTRLHRWLLACTASAALAVVSLAAPAEADAQEFGLELHAGGQHAYDPSFDALGRGATPNVFTAGTLGGSYHIGELVDVDGLHAYGAYGWAGTGGSRLGGDYAFQWNRNLFLAGAEYGYHLTPAIRPFARVTVGVAGQRLAVTPESGSTFSQRRFQFVTRDSLGFEFRTPFSRPDSAGSRPLALSENVSVGLTVQTGYLWQPQTSFGSLTAPTGEDDPWRRSGLDVGTVDASGWFWAFGGTLRIRL